MTTNHQGAESKPRSRTAGNHRLGRPSKLAAQVESRLLEAIRAGHHRQSAAVLAGVSPATLFRYLASDDERYRRFQMEVEKAEADLEAKLLEVVMDHVPRDPRLALSLLTRRFPDRWGAGREAMHARSGEMSPAHPTAINVMVVDPVHVEQVAQRRLEQKHRQTEGTAAPRRLPRSAESHRDAGSG